MFQYLTNEKKIGGSKVEYFLKKIGGGVGMFRKCLNLSLVFQCLKNVFKDWCWCSKCPLCYWQVESLGRLGHWHLVDDLASAKHFFLAKTYCGQPIEQKTLSLYSLYMREHRLSLYPWRNKSDMACLYIWWFGRQERVGSVHQASGAIVPIYLPFS